MCLYSHSTQYISKYKCNTKNSFNSEVHALNTISQQLHHMGGACCLQDRGVQKLTLNMLCPFLTSPGEGRPQHYITMGLYQNVSGVMHSHLHNIACGLGFTHLLHFCTHPSATHFTITGCHPKASILFPAEPVTVSHPGRTCLNYLGS